MAMSIIWCGLTVCAVLFSILNGTGTAVSAAVLSGAGEGVRLALTLAGPLLLWSGLARVMEQSGLTEFLARVLRPLLRRIFPESCRDRQTRGNLCANVTANLLGLGNAATPLGLAAVRRMQERSGSSTATDEMCRLIVMNTASIQLIPTTVAAVRAGLGCATPFDLLPAVWVTSLCSVTAGLAASFLLARVWR